MTGWHCENYGHTPNHAGICVWCKEKVADARRCRPR